MNNINNSFYKSDTILLKSDKTEIPGFISPDLYFIEIRKIEKTHLDIRNYELILHEHISNYDKGRNHQGKLILFDF